MRVIAVLLASLSAAGAMDSVRAPARALRAGQSAAGTAADALGVSARARGCNPHGEGCFWSNMFGKGNCCEGLVCRNRDDASGIIYCLPPKDARFRAAEAAGSAAAEAAAQASAATLSPEQEAKIKFADAMAKVMAPKADSACFGKEEGAECSEVLYKGTCKHFFGAFSCVHTGDGNTITIG